MDWSSFHSNKSAVAGVIEALLLVALVATVISTIQLVYIPEIMEQKEAEHMDEVENQFSHLKSVIDLQSQAEETGPISTAITLGSRELPYFVTARAFGRLHHIPNLLSNNNISISNESGRIELFNLSSIEYQSVNAYYLNQHFILEAGGVILKQDDGGEAMKIHPPVYFEKTEDNGNTINLNWTIYNFTVLGNKSVAEGYKSSYIRTQVNPQKNDMRVYEDVTHVNISTAYFEAWNRSLNWLKDQYKFNNNITITIQKVDDRNLISISPIDVNFTVNIKVVDISIQIGIGTIMQYPNKGN
ncbi:MAG: hypothetical protein KGY67_03610 [Candidatus Thermoplasmatota archaeon]|nr:hypothetical protein [Candidatus Thermoplasmatota archaeon]